ncbi:protein Smaug homolog 1-like isoform X3 [Lampetra planeri]
MKRRSANDATVRCTPAQVDLATSAGERRGAMLAGGGGTMFRDQVGVLSGWFKGWNECEQTVALLALLKRVSRTQARFLQLCLDHSLSESAELRVLEREANDPACIGQWQHEPLDKAVPLLLSHLPLLKPGNADAKAGYLALLPRALAQALDTGRRVDEARQLLSYALIHPALDADDRGGLAGWLNSLEEAGSSGSGGSGTAATSLGRRGSVDCPPSERHHQHHHHSQHHQQVASPGGFSQDGVGGCGVNTSVLLGHQRRHSTGRLNGWHQPPQHHARDSGMAAAHHGSLGWQENGHGGALSGNGLSGSTGLLKRSASPTPTSAASSLAHQWLSHEDLRPRGVPGLHAHPPPPQPPPPPPYVVCLPPSELHAPLSPQGSVASSGSGGSSGDHPDDGPPLARNTFLEEGSGMRDVPAWLKSLRLHKYAGLFSQLTYEEMMSLTEKHLEHQAFAWPAQCVTKGARHKIALSVQKLRERHDVLHSLEKDIMEGGSLVRAALQELHQMILTPIKMYSPASASAPSAHQDSGSCGNSSPARRREVGNSPSVSGRPPLAGMERSDFSGLGTLSAAHGDGLGGSAGAANEGTHVSEGDLPGQFTRVMGKVCTQLLVSHPDEDSVASYLQLLDKCLVHEAFTETQKKRLVSWKLQVQKLLRIFPRRALFEMQTFRQPSRGWGMFGQSSSLPGVGGGGSVLGGAPASSVCGLSGSRWASRPFPAPHRSLPGSGRLGLMGPGNNGLVSTPPRASLSSPAIAPAKGRQNLWFGGVLPGSSGSPSGGGGGTASGSGGVAAPRPHGSVQRTRSLPMTVSPQAMLLCQQSEFQVLVTEPEINTRLESLCRSMTEHALEDGMERTSTI